MYAISSIGRGLIAIGCVAFVAVLSSGAWADKLELENGDVIDVTIVSEEGDELVVEHPQLGQMKIPRSALKPPPEPEPGLFGTSFMKGWKRNVGFGFGGAQGNSQDASVNAELGFNRETESFRGNFLATYFYSSQNSVRNTNAFNGAYSHDFLFKDSSFFLFGQGRYQYDQFQEWLHRISGNGGAGYDFLRTDDYALSIKVGAGFARTEGNQNEWKPEGLLGLLGFWKPFEGHTFSADVTYFPDFKRNPQFRLLANASYQVAVSPIDGLALKFGLTNEYDDSIDTTLPVPNFPNRLQTKNNLKYYGNLVYEF